MGLDGVELVLEAEESFGISLSDEEISKSVTVGQFYDAIMRALPRPEKKFCLSAVTFHRLHQPLLAVSGKKRGEVRPSTRLDVLFPSKRRRTAWRNIQNLSGLRLPPLNLPSWAIPFILTCVALSIALGVLLIKWPLSYVSIATGILVFFVACWAANEIFGTELPSHCRTVGDLTKATLAMNFAKFSGAIANYDRDEVWESVRILVADQLNVEIEKVTKEAKFVADLGMS